MDNEKIVEAVRTEISRMRAGEVGGCFRPDDVPQGECADGDCYCFRQCDREARAAIEVHTSALVEAGFVIVPREPQPKETLAEEIARLNREIGQQQLRLQFLVCGDPRIRVTVPTADPAQR